MPEKKTLERARRDERQAKVPPTQAGEFVREEIYHVCEGKHGARSTKQAIAIGLSRRGTPGRGGHSGCRRKVQSEKPDKARSTPAEPRRMDRRVNRRDARARFVAR